MSAASKRESGHAAAEPSAKKSRAQPGMDAAPASSSPSFSAGAPVAEADPHGILAWSADPKVQSALTKLVGMQAPGLQATPQALSFLQSQLARLCLHLSGGMGNVFDPNSRSVQNACIRLLANEAEREKVLNWKPTPPKAQADEGDAAAEKEDADDDGDMEDEPGDEGDEPNEEEEKPASGSSSSSSSSLLQLARDAGVKAVTMACSSGYISREVEQFVDILNPAAHGLVWRALPGSESELSEEDGTVRITLGACLYLGGAAQVVLAHVIKRAAAAAVETPSLELQQLESVIRADADLNRLVYDLLPSPVSRTVALPPNQPASQVERNLVVDGSNHSIDDYCSANMWKADAKGASAKDNVLNSVSLCLQRDIVEHYAWFHRPELMPSVLQRWLNGELQPGHKLWSGLHVRPVAHLGRSLEPLWSEGPGFSFEDESDISAAEAAYDRVSFNIIDGAGNEYPLFLEFRGEPCSDAPSGESDGELVEGRTGTIIGTVKCCDQDVSALTLNLWSSVPFFAQFVPHSTEEWEEIGEELRELCGEIKPSDAKPSWLKKYARVSKQAAAAADPLAQAELIHTQLQALLCRGCALADLMRGFSTGEDRVDLSLLPALSCWHPARVCKQFNHAALTAAFDAMYAANGGPLMPSDCIGVIAEFAPLELPFVPMDATEGRRQDSKSSPAATEPSSASSSASGAAAPAPYVCSIPRKAHRSYGDDDDDDGYPATLRFLDAKGKRTEFFTLLEKGLY